MNLTGGEPMVRRDFWELVDEIRRRNILIPTLYSNGLLITDAFLDELEKRGLRPNLQFSFDGVGYHDWMRGIPGAEKVVLDAIRRRRARDPHERDYGAVSGQSTYDQGNSKYAGFPRLLQPENRHRHTSG